jgi:hypothetical protein
MPAIILLLDDNSPDILILAEIVPPFAFER